jgi:hypothetical protein
MPDELWVRVIYDIAVSYHRRVISPEHIIRAMTPLYMGRVASFVAENLAATAAEVEEKIDRLGMCFEENKSYLLERW